ncbi:MAG: YhfT family protein [Halanaerobium sp.]
MQLILIGLIGAMAAVLANKGIAVFNDSLRPIIPEYVEERMSRKELAATSFAMSFGLVIGFGIPFSLSANIILIHSILLGTDIIGTWAPDSNKGSVAAGVVGALYGIGLTYGLETIVNLFELLPVNFMEDLGTVGDPIVVAFAAFPALAVAYQFGIKKGLFTLTLAGIVRQIAVAISPIVIRGIELNINPEGMALIAGMTVLLIFAAGEKGHDSNVGDLVSIFSKRVKRIKKNLPYLAVMGGLVSAATASLMLAGDPISLNLISEGVLNEAALAALARAVGFVPLIATTAISTGVYGPVGMTFIFAAALFINNPVIAAIAGAVIISIEILLLDKIAALLDKFPGIKKAGDNIRTAMSKVLEIALLVGGMNAANAIIPGFGFFFVAGVYILNEIGDQPIVKMAVGPTAAILVGIIANILAIFSLV